MSKLKKGAKKGGSKNPINQQILLELEDQAKQQAGLVNDIDSEENKKAMRAETRRIRDQLEEEKKLVAFYQQEREKLNYHWIVAKKALEDKQSEHLNKQRELEDLKENHMMTTNLYKQKVKHLLFQNQDYQTELKKEVEGTLKKVEDEHRLKERELKTDKRTVKVQLKEQEIGHYDYLYALNTDFDKKYTHARGEYERRFHEVKAKYSRKLSKLRQEMEELRQQQIKDAEAKKEARIQQLKSEHNSKRDKIKNYYSDITATNLDLIKQLKNEISELQKQEDKDKKMRLQIEKQQNELQQPLKQLEDEIMRLDKEQEEHKILQKEKEEIKRKIEEKEIHFRKLEYEYEVKLQQYTYLEKEKTQLYDKFHSDIYEINQKIGLKNLILEKKVACIEENIEVKDLELNELLGAANVDPSIRGGIKNTLEEVEQIKNDMIKELEQQLLQIRKAHSHMVKAYEGKLSEFVIPVEELGFDPLVPTNTD